MNRSCSLHLEKGCLCVHIPVHVCQDWQHKMGIVEKKNLLLVLVLLSCRVPIVLTHVLEIHCGWLMIMWNTSAMLLAIDCGSIWAWCCVSCRCAPRRQSIAHANTLLSMKHGMVRLDSVWGPLGGGLRPVKVLEHEMELIIQEYVSCGDQVECERCLRVSCWTACVVVLQRPWWSF